MKLQLHIEFGNAAMQTPWEAGAALHSVIAKLNSTEPAQPDEGIIRDVNGNTVGRWSIKED